MAAYAAMNSFILSLEDFLNSFQAYFVVPAAQLQLLQSAYHELVSLYKDMNSKVMLLKDSRQWREREKALVKEIRDAAQRVEHKFDEQLYTHSTILSSHPLEFTHDFQAQMIFFLQLVANANKTFAEIWEEGKCLKVKEEEGDDSEEEFDKEEEEKEEVVESYEEGELRSTTSYKMVGLVNQFIQLRRHLLLPKGGLYQVSIVGMAGIGKTAMAKQLYNDPLISRHFERRGFVSVGRSAQLKQVVIDILSQIQDRVDIVSMQRMSVGKLLKYLEKCMACKRCLIVLDDVWNDVLLKIDYLLESRETRVLITTRKASVAFHKTKFPGIGLIIKLRLLNEEESWCLFCEKTFGKDYFCPFKLVEVGKKIVENCEGLPLAIIAIADVLAQGEMSFDHWKKVSEDPNPLSIGTNHQHPSLNPIYSSYDELEEHLKPCFLYMGVFPCRQEIPVSKLTRLWEAERLVKPLFYSRILSILTHEWVMEILKNLSSQSVIFVALPMLQNGFKTCRLHSVFWHLCVSEVRKEFKFQVVNKYLESSFQEDLRGHHRICVHNNTLFGIKDANKSMLSIPNARSLLCTGPHHHYPVPMEFQMKLLRVLEVVTIRFYVFPSEVVQLVLLRYLAFAYTGMLHASISHLWNLESLIVEPHMRIISLDDPLYMPVEIWKMKKLRHLQVTGALLPHPPDGAILPNLFSISKINAKCLTTAVFDSIPRLRKLSIQIDLSTHDPFCFSDHLSRANELLSLKCIVLNPKPRCQAVDPPPPLNIFPSNLIKLTLSGFGYPWKHFQELGRFNRLKVVKVQKYAFQGPMWKQMQNSIHLLFCILKTLI